MSLRILLVDSYDSFTHNLAALCRQSIPHSQVHIIQNDTLTASALLPALSYFSAIIIGPGPGSPLSPSDIGVIPRIWSASPSEIAPVFGVCLGLQSLAVECGDAELKRLSVVKHGQISRVEHDGREIFKGVGLVDAVRYHSLHVELPADGDVEALAWADDGEHENGKVVMAVKHKSKPFWAVQYHPESVKTSGGGVEVFSNFWRLATAWSASHGRIVQPWDDFAQNLFGDSWPRVRMHTPPSSPKLEGTPTVSTTILHLPGLAATTVCELFGAAKESNPFVLLQSASSPGRFSIIGALSSSTPHITYHLGDSFLTLSQGKLSRRASLGSRDIWAWLASFMRSRKAIGGEQAVPFWGGLVGYLSYELGVASLTSIPVHQKRHPDVNLVFVERSVVVDNLTGDVYVQSIMPDDHLWLSETSETLKTSHREFLDKPLAPVIPQSKRRLSAKRSSNVTVSLPDRRGYISRIKEAKDFLLSGDSYELCLTAQTKVTIPSPSLFPLVSSSSRSEASKTPSSSSWKLYTHLLATNPAPYSAYLRLQPTTLLCSSPERFLSYTRPPHTICQLRPIKGTIRKSPAVGVKGGSGMINREEAEKALRGSTKEVAENLMIVDLIRHDLFGVLGPCVEVKSFCGVEEYETVWQMVSVIEGKAGGEGDGEGLDEEGELGWEVLRRSFPPGSMTGAPKKRSVEILQALEETERSVYSGVSGYWDVGGGGDWSVIIRSCFKYDDGVPAHMSSSEHEVDSSNLPLSEEWTIGAGGAITALSDPEAEWDEMVIKLQSVLRAFEAATS